MKIIINRDLVEQALAALEYHVEQTRPIWKTSEAIAALRAALAEPFQEPVMYSRDALDAAVAAEREACAKVCDFEVARLTAIDEPRAALAVGICAAAIRARSKE